MLKAIIAILLVSALSLKELLHSKKRGIVMGIYFTLMGISMLLAILISINKQPTSPIIFIMDALKGLGLGLGLE